MRGGALACAARGQPSDLAGVLAALRWLAARHRPPSAHRCSAALAGCCCQAAPASCCGPGYGAPFPCAAATITAAPGDCWLKASNCMTKPWRALPPTPTTTHTHTHDPTQKLDKYHPSTNTPHLPPCPAAGVHLPRGRQDLHRRALLVAAQAVGRPLDLSFLIPSPLYCLLGSFRAPIPALPHGCDLVQP